MVHVVTNDGKVFSNTFSNELYLYLDILRSYNDDDSSSTTSLWLSKAPCAVCTDFLNTTFRDRSKPRIYVASLKYNEENLTNLLDSIGCLAKLEVAGFAVKSWDWTLFETYVSGDQCIDAINAGKGAADYVEKKEVLDKFANIFGAFNATNNIGDWCN